MEKILTALVIFTLILTSHSETSAKMNSDKIRVPLHSSTVSLDPTGIQDQSSLWVSRQVNCQLVRSNSGVLTMEAAQSLKYSDPKTLLVTLRNDIFFHDHSTVTSDDVIATFEHLRTNRNLFRSIFGWVERIEKVDSKNFKIVLNQSNPQFLNTLSAPNYAIFKKSFIESVAKEKELWENPLGCGQYQVEHFDRENHVLNLKPTLASLPAIEFDLLGENQISSEKIKNYDIVGLTLIDGDLPPSNYRIEKIFDPYHIFLGLNTRLPEWQSKENRCALFAQLDREKIISAYGETAEPASDILPRGILGYSEGTDYPLQLKNRRNGNYTAPKKNFCISTLSVSVPLERRQLYADMARPFFENVLQQTLDDPKSFGTTFASSGCDALVLGLKSNVLDGYEYLLTLADSNDRVNFTGYTDTGLQQRIKASQDLIENSAKATAYRDITETVRNECLYYPILTIPMKKIYIKETRQTPGLGEAPLNEYFLGKVL